MLGSWNVVPLHYRMLAWLALALSLVLSGFYAGHHWATTKAEALRTQQAEEYARHLQVELKRADGLSNRLAAAEARTIIKTVEVIKHVPSVTTGRLCLEPAAVRMLQSTEQPAATAPASEPVAENAEALAASDRDVAYWVADARQLYETCAERLNTLIEWHTYP